MNDNAAVKTLIRTIENYKNSISRSEERIAELELELHVENKTVDRLTKGIGDLERALVVLEA